MIPKGFKPMLACKADLQKIKFPCMVSRKLDGVRCVVFNGVPYSRKLKPIPNAHVQKVFADLNGIANGLDGELIVGDRKDPAVFRNTMKGVMSFEGEPEVSFWAFDTINPFQPYRHRYDAIPSQFKLESYIADSIEQLISYEEVFLAEGYEGLMVRSLDGPYKYGRSSVKEGYLLKVKRFEDAEAEVIGFEERMHNANEATVDNLGRTERSSHKENMIPMNTLGSLICVTPEGQEFKVGTGFSDQERSLIWDNRPEYLGKLVKYSYTKIGAKDSPRFPSYIGFRSPDDL